MSVSCFTKSVLSDFLNSCACNNNFFRFNFLNIGFVCSENNSIYSHVLSFHYKNHKLQTSSEFEGPLDFRVYGKPQEETIRTTYEKVNCRLPGVKQILKPFSFKKRDKEVRLRKIKYN